MMGGVGCGVGEGEGGGGGVGALLERNFGIHSTIVYVVKSQKLYYSLIVEFLTNIPLCQ